MTPAERRQHASELHRKGLTYAEIGQLLGVSRQRAQQLTRPEPSIERLVRKRADNRCEQCTVPLSKGHIHHRGTVGIEAENFQDVTNLMYVCVSCHARLHWTDAPAGNKPPKRRVYTLPGRGSV